VSRAVRQFAACRRVARAWKSSSASSPKTLRRPNASHRFLEMDTEPATRLDSETAPRALKPALPGCRKTGRTARAGGRVSGRGRFARLRAASHRSRSRACPPPRPQTSRSCSRAAAVAAAARGRRARLGHVDLVDPVANLFAPARTCAARMRSLWTPCRRTGRRRAAWLRCGGGSAQQRAPRAVHARVPQPCRCLGRPRRPHTGASALCAQQATIRARERAEVVQTHAKERGTNPKEGCRAPRKKTKGRRSSEARYSRSTSTLRRHPKRCRVCGALCGPIDAVQLVRAPLQRSRLLARGARWPPARSPRASTWPSRSRLRRAAGRR
jgi:hypothetical protein